MNVQESRIGRRVVVGLALSVAAAVSAAPTEYVWTGAQDAYWTNAANWTVGGAVATDAPGVRFTTKDWQTFTNMNATASFGAVAGGARTTIDLDGLFFVSNLVVKAGAPKYTFGTAGQYLGLAHEGGRFTVEKGAAAPAVSGVYGFLWYPGMKESKPDTYDTPDEARFVNESEGELVLSNFGNTSPNAPSSGIGGTWCRFIGLGGTGDIRIDSWSKKRTSVALNLYPEGSQRLLLVGTTADPKTDQLVRGIQVGGGRKATVVVVEKTLELGQGTEVTTGEKKMPVVRVRDAGTRLTFTGDGVVGLHGMNQKSKPETFGKGFVPAGANIDAGAELVFVCKVDGFFGSNAVTQKSPQESFYFHRGAGTLSFTRTDNAFEGGIDLLSFDKANATLAFTDPGQMGPGAIRIGNAGRLLYTGTEALAFGKDLAITNKTVGVDYEYTVPVDASATVEQGGAGALTVTSPVDISGTGGKAVLTLANSTASAATWAGVLKDAEDRSKLALAKTGSGAWTLTAKNTFTGGATVKEGTLVLAAGASLASPVTISNGATFAPAKGADLTLSVTIEDGGTLFIAESQTLPFAVKAAGTAKLLVGADADVVIPVEGSGPAAAGGKLVLCLEENARVKMSDGSKPDWLGFASPRGLLMPMKVDEDGFFELVETSWKGAGGTAWTDAANWTKGVPTVDCAAIVNAAGTVEVPAGAAAVAVGTVELDAGTVSVKGTLPISVAEHHERFVVGSQGALQIDGGTVTAAHAKGVDDYALHLDGGTLALAGAATLDLTGSKGLLGMGSVTVDTADGAAIRIVNGGTTTSCFSTGDSEGTLEMTVGRKPFKSQATGYVSFGDSQKGTFRLTVEDKGTGNPGDSLFFPANLHPRGVYAGRQSGRTEIVLQSGSLQGGNQGVTVATATAADAAVTGRVVVAGGRVYASSGYVGSSWSGIGFGVSSQKTDPAAVRGELLLEAGEVSVGGKSPLGFGIGGASGFGLQTGGSLSVKASEATAVLGYGSGTGEYILSNGTFAVNRPLYVGGCMSADLLRQYGFPVNVAHAPGRRAATGRLCARGGTLAATNELGIVVGADGRGRLEIGPSGNVTAKALVVSNNVEGVLAFELGARKAGTLKADKLVIAPGAKLEIDARALAADSRGTIHLADCGAVEGLFAASDVTILSPIGQEKRFAHAMILTERSGKKGLWLMLQPRGLMMVIR